MILYHVIGYRREVIRVNLSNAFPEKSPAEIKELGRRFYIHLCDLFLETFKTLTISKESMIRHCSMSPAARALFDKLADEKTSVVLVMGHHGNWEWAGNSFSLLCKQQLYVIYHPLNDKHFNRLIVNMRSRFGTRLIEMRNTIRQMIAQRNELSATAFIADQTPAPESAYWTTFLNQDTPVFWGTEKIARKLNYPVVYAFVKKLKRGYYEIQAEMLVEKPSEIPDGGISELHTRRLEKDILLQPETWLWSHRRWKHKRMVN
jgi:KDO2-lipid IV(A) lauroyltransferase